MADKNKNIEQDNEQDLNEANTENVQDSNKEISEEQDENTDETVEKEEEKAEPVVELSEVEILQAKLSEVNDKYLRLSAEFDNYRKRTLKERMDLIKTAGEDILINLLPVKDNMERALKSMDDSSDIKAVKEGVDLIYANFSEFLKVRGIKEIEAVNETFDTDLHEALTKIPAPSKKKKGKIIDVIEKGYKLNDKVIRFSKVVVGE